MGCTEVAVQWLLGASFWNNVPYEEHFQIWKVILLNPGITLPALAPACKIRAFLCSVNSETFPLLVVEYFRSVFCTFILWSWLASFQFFCFPNPVVQLQERAPYIPGNGLLGSDCLSPDSDGTLLELALSLRCHTFFHVRTPSSLFSADPGGICCPRVSLYSCFCILTRFFSGEV